MGFGNFLKSAGKAALDAAVEHQEKVNMYYEKNEHKSDEELIKKLKETGYFSASSNEKLAIRKILKDRGTIN